MPGLPRIPSVAAASRAYHRHRSRTKARSAAITLAGQDIAPVTPVKDPARRALADDDFRFFCETYFPHLSNLAWSADHLRVIEKIDGWSRTGRQARPVLAWNDCVCLLCRATAAEQCQPAQGQQAHRRRLRHRLKPGIGDYGGDVS